MEKKYEVTAECSIPAQIEQARLMQITVRIETNTLEIYMRRDSSADNFCEYKSLTEAQMDAILSAAGIAGYESARVSKVQIKKTDTKKQDSTEQIISK